jgi:endonuclease YncB( thermonuclease family)
MKPFAFIIALILLAFAPPANAREVIAGPVPGKVLAVLDGDTVAVRLHIWIGQDIETHVRIAGIDTPEMKGKCAGEREKAAAARAELEKLLADSAITLSNIRHEKYAGRVMAVATNSQGVDLGGYLTEKGFARRYQGKKRLGWCE